MLPRRHLGSFSWQKQDWTFSVLVENKFGHIQCLCDEKRVEESERRGPNSFLALLNHF